MFVKSYYWNYLGEWRPEIISRDPAGRMLVSPALDRAATRISFGVQYQLKMAQEV